MNRKYLMLISFLFSTYLLLAQKSSKSEQPKLVVGLVVDQMRWDYLYRYQNNYVPNGFKRLIEYGFSCDNTLIPYLPTYTAPGHTCIYTGSVPAIHGIVGNDWYDVSIGSNMYCSEDTTVNTIGSNSVQGKMSPRNLATTTIGDELRLSNNFKSKVIGIAIKDRGAIFPAGHAASSAYWFDDTNGKWITSSYYTNELPEWVKKENAKALPDKYMAQDWNPLMILPKYKMSTRDNEMYEGTIPGEVHPIFPHPLSDIKEKKYVAFKYTPFAATYTFEMAKSAVENENLGKNSVPDLLTISISSTDYMGHTFGPNSIEAEDTYLRLDKDIADFLNYLDTKVGKGKYLLFLSADHGAAHVPGFAEERRMPAGTIDMNKVSNDLKKRLQEEFGLKNAFVKIENNQVYLDYNYLRKHDKSSKEVEDEIIHFLNELPFIDFAFSTKNIVQTSIPKPIKKMLINGYNPKRSGQIGFVLRSGYLEVGATGTTHGAWNPYDAHIPLIWFGTNVKPGKTNRETYMTDIAPTIAAMLNIQMPSGNVGKVIEEVIR